MEPSAGLDFASGIPIGKIPEGGMIQGKAGEDDVILTRRGDPLERVVRTMADRSARD